MTSTSKRKSKVYLYRFTTSDQLNQIQSRLKTLFHKAGFDAIIEQNDLTAIKVHMGEKGNVSYLSPDYVEPVVRLVKSKAAKPFISDTNVLYKSERDNAINHLLLAQKHGFTIDRTGAPVIIADGIAGQNEKEVEINAPLNKKVALAAEYINAHSIIVMSHATGHLATGMGATIKNLGMGMDSRKGKLVQHSVSKPTIDKSKCTTCGVCAEWCPVDAIQVQSDYAVIDEDECIGCGECLAVCRFDAVNFKWDSSSEELQKQIVEHALGIVRDKEPKIGYMTFMITMTKDCDCMAQKPISIIDDIGVLAGKDPVAIDQAVSDLTKKQSKANSLARESYANVNGDIQLSYGEQVGLGSRDYELIEI